MGYLTLTKSLTKISVSNIPFSCSTKVDDIVDDNQVDFSFINPFLLLSITFLSFMCLERVSRREECREKH